VEKEVSDLTFSRVECPRCGAIWMNGQHYWHTGKLGDEETLSNLVCGIKNFNDCINPRHKEGHIYGDKDTWEKRSGRLEKIKKELDDA
jgi:ribosomal protein S27AE